MKISEPKRLPLPEAKLPPKYGQLRKALNALSAGEMVEIKLDKSKVSVVRGVVYSISKNNSNKQFAIRTLTNDGETVEIGVWRI